MRSFLLFVILFFGFQKNVLAQNSFGSLHSNYAPSNSLYLNPSNMLDAKVWLDVNIVGAGTYINNDLVYLKNRKIFNVFRDEVSIEEDDIYYNQSRNNYHAYNRTFASLPSVVWSQGDHALGLSFGVRSYTGLRRVPDFVTNFIENGVPDYTQQHDIDYSVKNLKLASITFGEAKLSYAYTFLKKRKNMFMGGISVSKFFTIAGGASNVYEFNFNVDNDSVIDVEILNADAMFTPEPIFHGKGGLGFDLGFTFQRMIRSADYYYPNSSRYGCRKNNYKYKIGVSIIDIGSVKFDQGDYLFAGYNFDDFNWLNYTETDVNEDNPLDLFEEQEADITQGTVKRKEKIRLPTFISAQFDYNLWDSRVYINGTVIQGINTSKRRFGLRHANSLSVTPRFESYWFDFALPFSMYEYQHPQLGASMRLGPLTIGTDKLINWIFRSDVYGADIYVYLKVPLHYHPKCRDKAKINKRGWKDRSPTRCTY